MSYNPALIEPKWQKYWDDNETFRTETDFDRKKFYILDMFPYPSGAGLHVGHPEGYTATDILSRFKRMLGFNVLHPMGWDSYGLPAERYAMRTGIHPSVTTRRNIDTFKRQIKRLGFSYDWNRELATTDPEYIRWTQWIFLKLYERGLAYEAEIAVNWCPRQGTVLANEEVKDGKYVETGDPVERRLMRQWMLKITVYAQRLLDDLEDLDWPDGIKAMQRNWIGKSDGAEVTFAVQDSSHTFSIFTTRPDTLFGATYCVLAPEHPFVQDITTDKQRKEVNDYVTRTRNLTDFQRTEVNEGKTGVFTGAFAINPMNGARIAIWVADYVIMAYGSGAIMAVPAHDVRDHEFALKFGLPIIQVVHSPEAADIQKEPWVGDGVLINSLFLNGMSVDDAKEAAIKWVEEHKFGSRRVQYKLRDWLFSRQRYWGEPFPILHLESGEIVPLPEDQLPLLSPELDDYRPTDNGDPPLGRAYDWVQTVDPNTGAPARRELNTMPQWAGSCWYYLRFIDPHNKDALIDPSKERYWMPVDLYVGGAEHAVLHLLYARFWHKVLYDIGVVSTKEPFQKLFNQGMILAYSYQDENGKFHSPEEVKKVGQEYLTNDGEKVNTKIEKMSKGKLNVVNPDEVVTQYGADSLRLYEMFMGPLDVVKPWQSAGLVGVRRFLERSWRLICNERDGLDVARIQDVEAPPELLVLERDTIVKVTEDIEHLRFNTAISKLMEMVNALNQLDVVPVKIAKTFVLLMSPFAPHISEELWNILGNKNSLAYEPWPVADMLLNVVLEDVVEYVVQINGKVRAKVTLQRDLDEADLIASVRQNVNVLRIIGNSPAKNTYIVPNKIINFVI